MPLSAVNRSFNSGQANSLVSHLEDVKSICHYMRRMLQDQDELDDVSTLGSERYHLNVTRKPDYVMDHKPGR